MGIIQTLRKIRAASQRSRKINDNLRAEAEKKAGELKILLLGPQGSGKSTFMKQLRILHGNGFSNDECLQYKRLMYEGTIRSWLTLVSSMEELDFDHPDTAEVSNQFVRLASKTGETEISSEVTAIMKILWNDSGVRECFRRSRTRYQQDRLYSYFLNNWERICADGYVPSKQDVLSTKTTAPHPIEEIEFTHMMVKYRFIDVQGQKSTRRKWIHHFENVVAVIFIVALDEYDLESNEDPETNRLKESMNLFESVCKSSWFLNSHLIIFFNKKDLFKEKLKTCPLNEFFPEYTGPNTEEMCADFIQQQFMNLDTSDDDRVYSHFTCAVDTETVIYVFNAIADLLNFSTYRPQMLLF